MSKHSNSRHGVTLPAESTFASLELTNIDNVFFAFGENAASVGYVEPTEADSDVMHPQDWLVTITEKAKKHAAKQEIAKNSGDFTKHYVNIDSVDLGDEDEAAHEEEDDDDDAYEKEEMSDGDEDRFKDEMEEEDDDDDDNRKKRGKIEWKPSSNEEAERRRAMDEEIRHDQYDLMQLIAAREDDLKAATDAAMEAEKHQPKAKKARREKKDDDEHDDKKNSVPSIGVSTSFVEIEPQRLLAEKPKRGSVLLDSTVLTEADAERLSKFELPSWEPPKKAYEGGEEEKPIVFKMPRIGDEEGDEERREARHRRLQKVLKCDVAAFVNERLTPYYKARRFANKESYKYLAMHLTEKVVSSKVKANSYVMTEHTRQRIKKLINKTMHPRGAHPHYVYDAAAHKHIDDDDDDSDSEPEPPSPLNHQ